MEFSSIMNCLMSFKEDRGWSTLGWQIFFFKLAVMPTRALFAGGVAMVEAREQVMFDTWYVAVLMATEINTEAFLLT